MYNSRAAFSLIELSLVLVILGLLTGGILAGQSLIRASQLRSVSNDVSRYSAAIYAFRDKYFSLPGDITNATQFWGSAGGNGKDTACYNRTTDTKATCDGNGNGMIDTRLNDFGSGYALAEPGRAWQQLANAGVIEGSYVGITGSGSLGIFATIGMNTPVSKIANATFIVIDTSTGFSSGSERFSDTSPIQTLTLLFGSLVPTATPVSAVLSPEEAWNIDTKMDDGKPDAGLVSPSRYLAACFTGTYPNAEYALSTTGNQCALRFAIK
jgi:prepilin-type N-terminal cleavage/methylation domain-containing protein